MEAVNQRNRLKSELNFYMFFFFLLRGLIVFIVDLTKMKQKLFDSNWKIKEKNNNNNIDNNKKL